MVDHSMRERIFPRMEDSRRVCIKVGDKSQERCKVASFGHERILRQEHTANQGTR